MCGLELSKDWLTSEFQEKTVSINKEMSLTMRLSFCTRTNRTLARQLQPPLPNSSTAVFGASINDVQKQEGTNIPFVIATCIQEIDHRGLKEEGLYRIAGSTSAILKLKKAFEKHSKQAVVLTGEADIAVVTAIVKRYFRELPESLFTDSLYKELAKAVSLSDPETKQSLISQQIKSLPEPNRSTIVYIIDHLVRVASHESDNRMSLRNLAMVFGPTLLCSPSDDLTSDPQNLEQLVSKAPRDIAVQTTILHSVLELCRTNGSLF
jgi:breakpoint cluster region protein